MYCTPPPPPPSPLTPHHHHHHPTHSLVHHEITPVRSQQLALAQAFVEQQHVLHRGRLAAWGEGGPDRVVVNGVARVLHNLHTRTRTQLTVRGGGGGGGRQEKRAGRQGGWWGTGVWHNLPMHTCTELPQLNHDNHGRAGGGGGCMLRRRQGGREAKQVFLVNRWQGSELTEAIKRGAGVVEKECGWGKQ